MTRHIGRTADTNEQLVVVWMLIPEQSTHALVVKPDKLTDALLRRELMDTLAGIEAQRCETLADVIGRRQYADTQKSILQVLHERNSLTRLAIDEVMMTPDGNHRIPLRDVLNALGKLGDAPAQAAAEKFNPHNHNTVTEAGNEQVGVARNLLVEAEMLEADARAKRAQAYMIAPSLNPNRETLGAPAVAPTVEAAEQAGEPDTTNEQ